MFLAIAVDNLGDAQEANEQAAKEEAREAERAAAAAEMSDAADRQVGTRHELQIVGGVNKARILITAPRPQ